MNIKIGNRTIGNDQPPFIIAELSANHNGSLERALRTIDSAKNCGADAIKIQTYTADTMTINSNKPEFTIKGGLWDGYTLYDLYKWAETPYEWHEEIFNYAKKKDIIIFSTPFDETAVDLLESLDTPAYKIASFEIVDIPLIKYAASTGKPLIISTGLASELEIEEAVCAARDAGCEDLILLHCISSYPAPIEQANISQIQELSNRFKVTTGLSDHTLGTVASIAAVSLGACLIEKHFTLDRTEKGPDSDFSLEPKDLEKLCSEAKCAWQARGKVGYERQKAEKENILFRRSLFFNKDLPVGHLISSNDIMRIRPGIGLAPRYFNKIVGKSIKTEVKKNQPIQNKDIKW